MRLNPVPFTYRQKKFVLLPSAVMAVSGAVVVVVVGIVKGDAFADDVGAAAIVVGAANG
jgi:hypothetical protein